MIAKVRAFLISLLHPTTSTAKICLEKEVGYKSVRVWSKDQAPLTLPRRHHFQCSHGVNGDPMVPAKQSGVCTPTC
jgi:hypothetical protein